MSKYVQSGQDYTIFHSVKNDAMELAPVMRESDILEIQASHQIEPLDSLLRSIEVSEPCLTLRYKYEIVAMFGISPEYKTIWLLGSPVISKISELFIQLSHQMISLFLEDEPYLFNFTDSRNKKSLKWLEKCGATFGEITPVGEHKHPFIKFEFRRAEPCAIQPL